MATLNDDAVAWPGWLEALAGAMAARPDAGMCASQVRLAGEGLLDSAGMLICADGSSKQRGHGEPPEQYAGTKKFCCRALPRRCTGAPCWRRSAVRRGFLPLLRGHRPWACARAGPGGTASTCRKPWWNIAIRTRPGGLAAESILRGAQPAVPDREELPGGALMKAPWRRWRATSGMSPRSSGATAQPLDSAPRATAAAAGAVCAARASGLGGRLGRPLEEAPGDPPRRRSVRRNSAVCCGSTPSPRETWLHCDRFERVPERCW